MGEKKTRKNENEKRNKLNLSIADHLHPPRISHFHAHAMHENRGNCEMWKVKAVA